MTTWWMQGRSILEDWSAFPDLWIRYPWLGPGTSGKYPLHLSFLTFDQVSANLVEAGDDVLVLNTGYFGDSFADW